MGNIPDERSGGITVEEGDLKAADDWNLDHEEKARRITEQDLNRKHKQVSCSHHCLFSVTEIS
jgi:hypothetical protein